MGAALAAAGMLGIGAGVAIAQAPAAQRIIVDRADTRPGQEAVLARADFPAGGDTGLHFHHGLELGTVIDGSVEVTVEGSAPKTYHAGEAFLIPSEAHHRAIAVGGPARIAAVYVVDKGKPLAEAVK
jgi:quercetin dioxygenase-like cupin family protein